MRIQSKISKFQQGGDAPMPQDPAAAGGAPAEGAPMEGGAPEGAPAGNRFIYYEGVYIGIFYMCVCMCVLCP